MAAACLAMAAAASAATDATPEARAYIEKYGIDFSFDREQEAIALYDRILATTRHVGNTPAILRAQKYGADARNRLDVHYPREAAPAARPVIVFVHGGGFVSGDTKVGQIVYDNVADYFARHGLVAINMTYRLAPQFKWPSGVEDVAAALRWVKSHAQQFGGDPRRIFLFGHSAGAAHVADFIYGNAGRDAQELAGAILASGVYTVTDSGPDDAYYGTDVALRPRQSAMKLAAGGRALPTLILFAEYDPAFMQDEALDLARTLCTRDKRCPGITRIDGHNHLSEIFHFDTADDSGGREILAFITGVTGGKAPH